MTPTELASIVAKPQHARWTIGELAARVAEVRSAGRSIKYTDIDETLHELGLVCVWSIFESWRYTGARKYTSALRKVPVTRKIGTGKD